jgi:hypothetical protein
MKAADSEVNPAVETLFGAEALGRLRRRAEQAAASGQETFAVPEAALVVERVAAMAPPGPLRTEAETWLATGQGYHALVRLAARAVAAFSGETAEAEAVYVPKAADELEPMLRLWPSVLALPTTIALTPLDLLALRAFPVHPLGLVTEATWADGRLCTPAEYFFHDLDHARFKVREDLRVEGVEIPDAYQNGSTVDARTGRHRVILPEAAGRAGTALWERAEPRRALVGRLLARAAGLGGALAAAAELLLFEIVCEKSHPLEAAVLASELATDAHVAKIRRKHASGFYGVRAPAAATLAALDEARQVLGEAL